MTEAFTPKFTEGEIIEKIQQWNRKLDYYKECVPTRVGIAEQEIAELEKELALMSSVRVGEDEQVFLDECAG